MISYSPEIPPHVARVIRKLPPDLKKSVKEAIRALAENPDLGNPLKGDLKGLWKYRVRRYRIIYAPDRQARRLSIYAVGHRREIYDRKITEHSRLFTPSSSGQSRP